MAADGKRMPHEGQVKPQLVDDNQRATLSTFQITNVSRPFWSVSKLLDNQKDPDCEVVFRRDRAEVRNSKGKVIMAAERRGGLYVSALNLPTLRRRVL